MVPGPVEVQYKVVYGISPAWSPVSVAAAVGVASKRETNASIYSSIYFSTKFVRSSYKEIEPFILPLLAQRVSKNASYLVKG